jgi:hypothetical protein
VKRAGNHDWTTNEGGAARLALSDPIIATMLNMSRCLWGAVAYLFRTFHSPIDRRNDSSVSDVKIPHLRLEQAWQQFGIVHIRAMGQIPVRSQAGVDSDTPTLLLGKAAERKIV